MRRLGIEDEKDVARHDLEESDQMLIDLEMMLMEAGGGDGGDE